MCLSVLVHLCETKSFHSLSIDFLTMIKGVQILRVVLRSTLGFPSERLVSHARCVFASAESFVISGLERKPFS